MCERSAGNWNNFDTRSRLKILPLEKADWFLSRIPENGSILDFGAGIGQWAAAMATNRPDIHIDVLDKRANELSKEYASIPQIKHPIHSTFEEFRANNSQYDGIWAQSSLFFLTKEKLEPVLCELAKSLKQGGVLEFNFVEALSEHAAEFPAFYPLHREIMKKMVEDAGLRVIAITTVDRTSFSEKGINLPTYIIQATKN